MKSLEVEWRHLDIAGNTCVRCSETGAALKEVVSGLAKECRASGWDIFLKETKLTEKELAESNIILINGIPMEKILGAEASQSHCASCCEVVEQESVCCRTVEHKGHSYEAIPARLIREAVCAVAQCC